MKKFTCVGLSMVLALGLLAAVSYTHLTLPTT